MARPYKKDAQTRGGMFGDDGCIFRIYSSLYRIDNNDTYINRGVYLMIDWLINATGDQIVTVMIMIWLIIATIKIYIKEKEQ